MHYKVHPLSLAIMLALVPLTASAVDTTNTDSAVYEDSHEGTLQTIVVTANPLKSKLTTSPSTVLAGRELVINRAGTLGEMLNGLPGVSTTGYGPWVARPIIRGMDGDRIRLLQNGVGIVDASSLSYDHAIPQNTLTINKVEVVRGPAALMYGGNAIGGVVNTFDNRIPDQPVDGVHGSAETSLASSNDDRKGAFTVEGGLGNFALHADAFAEKSGELRIPDFARSARQRALDAPDAEQPEKRLPNSDGRAQGGSLGGSYFWNDGYAGLSVSTFDSNYGSVAEEGVRLKMDQTKVAFASEIKNIDGPINNVKVNLAYTDYEHKEIEDGAVGTTFKNEGYEGRIEAHHAKIGPLDGVFGLQFSDTKFSALGDEALVPETETKSAGLFFLENWAVSAPLTLSAGGRVDYTSLSPAGGSNPRFIGAEDRDFTAGSGSIGAVYKLNPFWSVTANGSYTERTPTFYELYANGPHGATGQYLVGNQNLQKEKAFSTDLGLLFENGPYRAHTSVYYTRFRNYLAELNTGKFRNDDGDFVERNDDGALPEAIYSGVSAQFYGAEFEGKARLWQTDVNAQQVNVDLRGDYTHAENRTTGQALPRISPLRLSAGIDYHVSDLVTRAEVTHAWAQKRVPENDLPTDGYTSFNMIASYPFKFSQHAWLAYVRADNITNANIRYASSVLRDIAPEAGRSVKAGLRISF
ncbi:TonB-dependent receptor [Aquirhabdus parva]|uniref:TonB-dependent receptor n=1 Tax=Aquirhabdus parva TaxID=2283318 RepID=A0A345P479_9GAMM|nr:TonB-dependent receptor [Aquirhabdus parva]AXI02088.1 TonB-dependent receptor [Aquirhabdus parva]